MELSLGDRKGNERGKESCSKMEPLGSSEPDALSRLDFAVVQANKFIFCFKLDCVVSWSPATQTPPSEDSSVNGFTQHSGCTTDKLSVVMEIRMRSYYR